MWDECDGFLVSLVVICGMPITTILQPQLIAGWSWARYTEAGIKPLDFVIIHQPKSPPCFHPAIFIPSWMYFLSYIIAQAQGRDFLFWEQLLVFLTLFKSGKQFLWVSPMITFCLLQKAHTLFVVAVFEPFIHCNVWKPKSQPVSAFSIILFMQKK